MNRWARYSLVTAISLIAWIALVEIMIRIFFPQPDQFHQLDPVYGYRGIPGKSGRYLNRGREFDARMSMNREGFRDVEHVLEKPAGVYRIIFLGDSFTEAKEVDLEKIYWRRLQAILPKLPDGRAVEIINMGMSGYGTLQQLLLLQNRGLAWRPDLVVVATTEHTDVWNNHRVLDSMNEGRDPAAPMKPYLVPGSDTLEIYPFKIHEVDQSILQIFRRNFQTYMFLRHLTVANPAILKLAWKMGFVETPPTTQIPIGLYMFRTDLDTDPVWPEAWDVTKRLFLEVKKTCDEANVSLLILCIPNLQQIDPASRDSIYPGHDKMALDWERPGKILNPFFEKNGIRYLYLLPALREEFGQNPGKPLYFARDGHFNPDGHQFVADRLKDFLSHLPSTTEYK